MWHWHSKTGIRTNWEVPPVALLMAFSHSDMSRLDYSPMSCAIPLSEVIRICSLLLFYCPAIHRYLEKIAPYSRLPTGFYKREGNKE